MKFPAAALIGLGFAAVAAAMTPLRVAENRRHLVDADGAPFLWIGDTGWHLVDALTREQAARYLDDRRQRGFTLIQTTVIMGARNPIGLTRNPATVYGHRAFHGGDTPDATRPLLVEGGTPENPNDFWDHLDWVVAAVRVRGLRLALLPCWGSHHVNARTRRGAAVIFDAEKARVFGDFLGSRYGREPHLIWVLGGDTNPGTKGDKRAVYRAMAEGLARGASRERVGWNQPHRAWDRLLITYHPVGPHSSAEFFHDDAWLDFNMVQTFKHRERTIDLVTRDYARAQPARPVVMGEPAYEGDADEPYAATSGALQVRRQAWQSFLSGACGFTYGALKSGANGPLYAFDPGWEKCLELPGATQIAGPLRELLAASGWAALQPAPDMFVVGAGTGELAGAAARSVDGRRTLVYFPENVARRIRVSADAAAAWISAESGERVPAGVVRRGEAAFTPPGGWTDAVLLLESR